MTISSNMMQSDYKIQSPLTFNCWKHHANYIKKQIGLYRNKRISVEELQKVLLVIGESQMDLYVGKLSPQKICDELVNQLKMASVFAFEEYKKWLFEKGREFRLAVISDSSVWTLRLGNWEARYVHIHPGR